MKEASIRIHVYRDAEEVATEVAAWLHHLASASTGRFSICLSGGTTPKLLYETLAKPPYLERFPWQRVHWFFGDERFVPHTHPDSNYRMALAAMFDVAPVLSENIHPVNTKLHAPRAAADDYERTLLRFGASELSHPAKTLFDIVLLG